MIQEVFTHVELSSGGELTICNLSENDRLLARGLAVYSELDKQAGLPYRKTFGNEIARRRAYKALERKQSSGRFQPIMMMYLGFEFRCEYIVPKISWNILRILEPQKKIRVIKSW